MDRILDEAQHTANPLHLVRLFGISPITAMRYLRAAHPAGLRPDLSVIGIDVDRYMADWIASWRAAVSFHRRLPPERHGCTAEHSM
ncbi:MULTISPECIES: hypothetical protein [Streptomyces]|uniref:Uncharacterized protein n=2 Tax=Streptomyces TaxID=1883 RepID=A0ABV9IXR0_9ACTN